MDLRREKLEDLIEKFFEEGIANEEFDEELLLKIVDIMFIKRHNSFMIYPVYSNETTRQDVKQDVRIKVLKNYMTGFILHTPGIINNDPSGFAAWLNTVITREVKTHSKKDTRYTNTFINTEVTNDEGESYNGIEDYADKQEEESSSEAAQAVGNCLSLVLSMNNKVEKIMLWLYYMAILTLPNEDHKTALNEVDNFKDQTLFEVYDFIYKRFKQFSWYQFDDQFNELHRRLDEEGEDGIEIGYHTVESFFNKKGKYTVSDWVNNINSKIKKQLTGGY